MLQPLRSILDKVIEKPLKNQNALPLKHTCERTNHDRWTINTVIDLNVHALRLVASYLPKVVENSHMKERYQQTYKKTPGSNRKQLNH